MDYRIAGQCRRAGIACALTAALLIPAQRADAANGNWLGTTNSTWATTTNWSGASAPTTNELATFNGTGNGSTTINLGSGVTLRSLVFNTSSAAAYTIGSGAVGSQTLTLNVAAWNNEQGGITVNSTVTNNQLFNANVVLGDASAYGHYIINNSTAATLTLAGNVTGGTGGTAGAKTLYLGGAGNTTISGTIGKGGATSLALNKTGAGTLTLSGNNSYTGTTTINQGTVNLDFSAATAPTTNIISATPALSLTGGTLRLDGKASTVNSQAVASTTVGAGNSAVALNLNSATSLLLDLKAITRSAGGTLNLSLPTGTQSSTNGVITTTTNLTNGVLVSAASNGIAYATVGGTDWAGLSSGNIVAMSTYQTGNGNYTTNNNLDVTNGDSVSGVTVNTLRFNGNNALTLSGNNTVNTGGVLVTSAASTGASISGGTLRSGGGKELVLINNGAQFTVGSDIADNATASALTISGPGTTTLSGTNTYTGATYINGGTVKAGSSQALGVNSNVTLSNNASSILNLNGNNLTIGGLNATGVLVQPISPTNYGTMDLSAASVALGSNTLTVGAGNASSTFGGSITGTGGSLVKIGTGGLVLNGNNTFTGGITIRGGSVTANGYLNGGATYGSGGQNTLGTGTITLGDATGGSDAATLNVGGLANSAMTYTNALVLAGTNAVTLRTPITNTTIGFNGNVTGTNSLTVSSAGGAFYTNGFFNNSGNLSFNGIDSINGGIGANVQNVTIVNGRGGQTLQMNAGINNTGTFTHSNVLGVKTQLGSIGSNVTALINTAGMLELSGANTFTGNTTLNGGTLVLMNNNALQMSGLDTSGAGVINATSRTAPTFGGLIGSKDIASVITTGYASITALTLNPQSGRSYTYSGNITNGAANMDLIKNGSGTQILSGTNTYSGNTTVSAGLLTITSNSSLPGLTTNGRYSVASGATLGVYNAVTDADIASMVATTNFRAGAAIGFDTTTANRTYSSNLTNTSNGTLGLTKLGSNTLTLSGTNTYNGSTTIAAGTLSVSSIGNNGSSSNVGSGSAINIGSLSSTGTLLYTGAAQTTNRTIVLSGTTGGAVIDQSGTGTLRFTSAVAATGVGNKTLTLQGSGTGELSGVVSDNLANTATTALVKAGTGIWTLSANNTYTGGTTLSSGTLGINATAALGTTGNITFSGGTMQFASGGDGAANFGTRIKNSASSMILDVNNGLSVGFADAIDSSNAVGLIKNGTGTLTLNASNTYTGGTTINNGTLALSGTAGSVAGAIAVNTGAALQFAHTADTSIANNISGAGNIVQSSVFTTTLNGTNTNTGSIQSTDGGTLLFSGAGALSSNITSLSASGGSTLSFVDNSTRTITLGSSGISLSTAKLSFDVDLSSSASDRLVFGQAASLNATNNIVNLNFLNSISSGQTWTLLTATSGLNGTWSLGTYVPQTGYSFSLTTPGGTSLLLTAAVSSSLAYWTGGNGSSWVDTNFSSTINGTASIAGSSLTTSSDVIFAGTNAGNLTTILGGNYSINTLAITTPEVAINGSNTLNVTSSSSTAISVSATGNTTVNAVLAGAAGLTKGGAGTLTLNGSNTYAGGTSITGGTVVVGSSTALGNSSGALTLNPGLGNTATFRSGATGLTVANNIVLSSGTTAFDTNSNNTTLSGVLSSLGALSKTGAGTLTLTGNNTHTGGITISAGGIALSGSGALADSEAINLAANGTSFDISTITASGDAIGSIAGASGSSITLGSKILTVGGDNTSTTFSGSLGGTGGALLKTGSGTLTLAGGNTYTGPTTISAGGLQIGNGDTTGSLSNSSTITNNGVLIFNRSNIVAQGTDFTSTAISGSGSLVQSGTGTLTLSSANSYSGGTTLNSGTLVLNNSTSIGTGALTINGGTLNNTSGNTITLTSNNPQNWNGNFAFTGSNDLNLGTGAVAIGNAASRTVTLNSGNLTVGGVISGTSSSLTKAGSGTLRLTGSNSYSGGTTISAGILEIAGSGTLNAAGNIVNNGTLLWNSSNSPTFSGIISGSGGIMLNGTGIMQINSSSNSFTGGVVINAGMLRLGGSGVIPTSNSVTINGGTLDMQNRNNAISLLTLTNGNVIELGGIYTSTLTATNGYILQNGSVSTILAGSGTLTKNGSGTVTLSRNNTLSGSTVVADGTLLLSGNGTLGTSTISLTGGTLDLGGKSLTNTFSSLTGGTLANGTLTNNGGNYALQNGTVSAILAGTNGVNKTGSGTTTLTGSNTYSGATTISAGNLSISSVSALTNTSGVSLANGTALIYTGGSAATLNRAISVTSGTGTIRNNGGELTLTGGLTKNGTTLTFDTGTFNITGAIGGSAASSDLIVDGATVTLNSANDYNGPTFIIDGGTLTANVTGALPTSTRTAISIDATGTGSSTLALGANQSIASLTGNTTSTVTLGTNTLIIGSSNNATSTTYAGRITGGASSALVKDGASTQVLTGNNTGFTGTTTVNGTGTLQAAAAGAMGNSTVINVNGGSFLVTAENAVNDNANINLGGGRLAVSGNFNQNVGALTLSADSVIDFSGFSGILRFSGLSWASGASNATLAIWNWSGTTEWGTQVNNYTNPSNLVFSNSANLTADNLAKISFYSDSGDSFVGKGFIKSDFAGPGTLIVAVPEPETYLTGVLLILGATVQYLRHRAKRKALYGHRPS